MNNNKLRLLERRRQKRRERLRASRGTQPPVPTGTCPLCLIRPGEIEAEINDSEGSERAVIFRTCMECSPPAKVGAFLCRHGFDELRRRLGA